MIKREIKRKTYFHDWLSDYRGALPVHSSQRDNLNEIRFFDRDIENPKLTNMDSYCQLPGDKIFRITQLELSAYFSSKEYMVDFIRSAILTLWIGDRPLLNLPAKICLHKESNADSIEGVTGIYSLDIPIFIPPRQPVYATVKTHMPRLHEYLEKEIPRTHGYAMISASFSGEEHSYPSEEKNIDWITDDEALIQHVAGKLFAKTTLVRRGHIEGEQADICKDLTREIIKELKNELNATMKPNIRDKAKKSWEDWDEKEIEREVATWNPSDYLDPNKDS